MTKDGEPGHEETNIASSTDSTVLMGIPLVSSMDVGTSGEDGVGISDCGIKAEGNGGLDELEKVEDEEEVGVNQLLSVVNAGGSLIRANHATLQSLLSTPISGSQVFAQTDGIQVITLPTTSDLMAMNGDMSDRLVHMVPTSGDLNSLSPTKYIGLIAISNNMINQGKGEMTGFSGLEVMQTAETAELNAAAAAILMPPPAAPPDLPPNCPTWATRLKKCEKIGDSYRGYVENEIDLDLILTLHKQQTNSFWGTRQSPSPAKTSTRLMWKSQYVPFDGIPFVNAGSRAVVMECQFGPRRKGTLRRQRAVNVFNKFKQTCPARIYIKKVRKYPTHAVDLNTDKKTIRSAMDKAFHELREQGLDSWGEERYYVQLPTEKAHDYHEEDSPTKSEQHTMSIEEPSQEQLQQAKGNEARIHPAVLEKIREMVAAGETKLYSIRKQLRKFVVRELFLGSGQVPERHDLTMFPTVNDLKNHIHQALKDIGNGLLAVSTPSPMMGVEEVQESGSSTEDQEVISSDVKAELSSMWSGANISSNTPMPETVTVTLTQNPGEDGHHIISRIETHLSDGTTQVSTTLTPETAQLLSRLHPCLFPAGSLLQLEGANPPAQNTDSDSLSAHASVLEATQDNSSVENPVSGLDASMVEGVHVIGGIDSSHLPSIVDMDSSHNISEIMDSDTANAILVNSDPSQTISGIHLDPNSTQNLSGLIDTESTNLANIVTSDSHHHIGNLSIPGSSLSVLSAVDSATISEMVSSGAAHLSIVPGHPGTIALVTGSSDSGHAIGLVPSDSDSNHLTLVGDEACDQIIHKSQDLEDHVEGHEKLSDDKITLHITSDQEIGMARLENKVSDL